MNPLSKNASLEESISKMSNVLKQAKLQVTFSQQKHPLQNCYSVNLSSVEAPQYIYSNGKGILSDACKASALGEYIERLQTNNFFSDFYLPKRKHYPDEVVFNSKKECLNKELLNIYDPDAKLSDSDLIDFNSDYTDKIVALPFIKNSTNQSVFIPVNILNNLYVSNGLATGNTPLEAQVQALSEIIERYAKIQIIKNAYALPKFPDEIIKSFTKIHKDITSLRELGYIVEVLDASLGGKFPVTAISLINPKNSTLFVSFGAYPILEVSLERTLTELLQGRSLDELDTFETPTFDMSIVSESFNLESHFIDSNGKMGFGFLSAKKSFEYTPFTYTKNDTLKEYDYLMNILKNLNKEVYLREYNYLDFYSCQIIVPDFSEIYPMDDLIYNNKNVGKFIRNMVLNFKDYDPQDTFMNIQDLPESLDMQKYIGVIFENNFTMLEFKAQLHLLMDEYEEALELLEYSNDEIGKIIVEIAHMEEMELDFKEYEDALYSIFTQQKVIKALRILDGDEYLIDTTMHTQYENILNLYDKLEKKKLSII